MLRAIAICKSDVLGTHILRTGYHPSARRLIPTSTRVLLSSNLDHSLLFRCARRSAHTAPPSASATGNVYFDTYHAESSDIKKMAWSPRASHSSDDAFTGVHSLPHPPTSYPSPSMRRSSSGASTDAHPEDSTACPGGASAQMYDQIDSMLRVDHAGETAAVRIATYHLWCYPHDAVVREIVREEEEHLAIMQRWVDALRVRPTVLDSIFHLGAALLAFGTAILGPRAVMCAHAAIEETITEHYNEQLRDLHSLHEALSLSVPAQSHPENAPPLLEAVQRLRVIVAKLRDDEQHHHELGMKYGAPDAALFPYLYGFIQGACSLGIWLAKRF